MKNEEVSTTCVSGWEKNEELLQFCPKYRSLPQFWPSLWLIETEPKDIKDEKDIKGLGGSQFRHHEGSILVNFDSTQ